MRNLIGTAALAAMLIAGHGVLPSIAFADEPPANQGLFGGLLQGVVDPVDDILDGTLDTTGLDEVVEVDLTSDDESLLDVSAGVSAPAGGRTLGVDAGVVGAPAGSLAGPLAGLNANVSLLDSALPEPLLNTAIEVAAGGPEGLATVGADVSAAGDGLLDTALDAGIATEGGLVTLDTDISAADGTLLDVDLAASVVGDDGLLHADIDASALDGELLDVSAELDLIGDVLAAVDLRIDTILGGLGTPSSVSGDVPGVSTAPVAPAAGPASVAPTDPMRSAQPAVPSVRLATVDAPAPLTIERASGIPRVALNATQTGSSGELVAGTVRSHLTQADAPASRSVVDVVGGALAPSLTQTFSHSHETLAVLAAAAALMAAAMLLKGYPGLLVAPASRFCLTPVSPG
ncbi:MAG: hypothetical protein GEU80_12915 [Dehalococcoidia bacterium]|nr:hypothetical protein [Dehalococcoidia bacterium]